MTGAHPAPASAAASARRAASSPPSTRRIPATRQRRHTSSRCRRSVAQQAQRVRAPLTSPKRDRRCRVQTSHLARGVGDVQETLLPPGDHHGARVAGEEVPTAAAAAAVPCRHGTALDEVPILKCITQEGGRMADINLSRPAVLKEAYYCCSQLSVLVFSVPPAPAPHSQLRQPTCRRRRPLRRSPRRLKTRRAALKASGEGKSRARRALRRASAASAGRGGGRRSRRRRGVGAGGRVLRCRCRCRPISLTTTARARTLPPPVEEPSHSVQFLRQALGQPRGRLQLPPRGALAPCLAARLQLGPAQPGKRLHPWILRFFQNTRGFSSGMERGGGANPRLLVTTPAGAPLFSASDTCFARLFQFADPSCS